MHACMVRYESLCQVFSPDGSGVRTQESFSSNVKHLYPEQVLIRVELELNIDQHICCVPLV